MWAVTSYFNPDGTAFHLWHGELSDRQYAERHQRLREFNLDPFSDIARDENGCWRWNTDKGAMHAAVRRYFETRNEDGAE